MENLIFAFRELFWIQLSGSVTRIRFGLMSIPSSVFCFSILGKTGKIADRCFSLTNNYSNLPLIYQNKGGETFRLLRVVFVVSIFWPELL